MSIYPTDIFYEPQSANSAWFEFEAQCKKKGLQPGAYTAFIAGYHAAQSTAYTPEQIAQLEIDAYNDRS